MYISNQKRMAADIFSKKEGKTVGIHRIWVNPDYLSEVADAVQKRRRKDANRGRHNQGQADQRDQPLKSKEVRIPEVKGKEEGPRFEKRQRQLEKPAQAEVDVEDQGPEEDPQGTRGSGEITPSQYRYFYRKAKGRILPIHLPPQEQHRVRWDRTGR